ncbi:unnamed protein product [Trichogramma brassicae]|uniref:Uncharacterized protein n=1 Tax=Trichogramma brassicae TaxID=86971 RepID=A0A6H5I8Y5_9HYME|nr:unnamed protein product [Trichogramma brassicae]
MSQSDTSLPANSQAEIERVLKYVDMTNDKMLEKMFELMNRLMNKVEGLCTSVKELDLRVSEQEAKSSAPSISPIKEDLENSTKIAVSGSGRIRTRTRPIQTPNGRTRQLLTVRAVAEATASIFHEQTEPSHVKTTCYVPTFDRLANCFLSRLRAVKDGRPAVLLVQECP